MSTGTESFEQPEDRSWRNQELEKWLLMIWQEWKERVRDRDEQAAFEAAWIKALAALPRSVFANHLQFCGWFWQIYRNELIRIKTRRRDILATDSEAQGGQPFDPIDTREMKEKRMREIREELGVCLEKLTDRARQVVLGWLEGMSFDELCAALGFSNVGVRQTKCRAMRELRECLEQRGFSARDIGRRRCP